MKAAVVREAGATPVYGDFREPEATVGTVRVTVSAAALAPLTRARASGTHYSAKAAFPFVPGVDGVGRLPDGRRVYFLLPESPFGAMAQISLVADGHWTELPDDLDDATAAAIANPGMSSWAALVERARIRAGETVLINGATGSAGRLAVGIARHLGATRVIATGRNASVLESLGADAMVTLRDDEAEMQAAFGENFADGVDIVLDYLWGASALAILTAAAKTSTPERPLRFVQIGSASANEISLPGALLRSGAMELMGSGLGSVTTAGLVKSIAGVFQAVRPAGLTIDTQSEPLARVGETWNHAGDFRLVYTVGTATS